MRAMAGCARARVGARVRQVLWERVAKHGNMPATHLSRRGLPSCISERNARVSIRPRTDHEVSAVTKTLPIYATVSGTSRGKKLIIVVMIVRYRIMS